MPTYSYRCDMCGYTNDRQVTVERRNYAHICPECPDGLMFRKPAAPAFTIDGYNAKNGYSK